MLIFDTVEVVKTDDTLLGQALLGERFSVIRVVDADTVDVKSDFLGTFRLPKSHLRVVPSPDFTPK